MESDHEAKPYLPQYEWEGLQNKYEIKQLVSPGLLPPGVETVEVWRDTAYNIQAKATGVVTTEYRGLPGGLSGTHMAPFDIEGVIQILDIANVDGTVVPRLKTLQRYRLIGCYMLSNSIRVETGQQTIPFERELLIDRVEKLRPTRARIERLTEWYLNGPRNAQFYSRSTKRSYAGKYTTYRGKIRDIYFRNSKGGVDNLDHVFVECADISFMIYVVPKECGPSWSKNIGVEYRFEWGGIPKHNEREAISEIVSFVVGRRLINVGYTSFDRRGVPIEEASIGPWGDNVVAQCNMPDHSPVKFFLPTWDITHIRFRSEHLLKTLVPLYTKRRDDLNLKEALWKYWLSRESPRGIDLPIVSSAIDAIADGWFESSHSKSKSKYMEKSEFDKLIRDELESIKVKLSPVQDGEWMLRKICDAYRITGNRERMDTFFREIGLRLGKVENDARKARHPQAHGRASKSGGSDTTDLRYAYHTLFHRVLLKVLGYNWTYVDYSTPGWAETHIDEPMAGVPKDMWADYDAKRVRKALGQRGGVLATAINDGLVTSMHNQRQQMNREV